MSRIYKTGIEENILIDDLAHGRIPGLGVKHSEHDAPWKHAVVDEQDNHAWMEGKLLVVWGANNETDILHKLANYYKRQIEFVG